MRCTSSGGEPAWPGAAPVARGHEPALRGEPAGAVGAHFACLGRAGMRRAWPGGLASSPSSTPAASPASTTSSAPSPRRWSQTPAPGEGGLVSWVRGVVWSARGIRLSHAERAAAVVPVSDAAVRLPGRPDAAPTTASDQRPAPHMRAEVHLLGPGRCGDSPSP